MPELLAQRIPESKRVGGQLNMAFTAGLITNAQVSGNSTLTALKAAIDTAAIGPNRSMVPKIKMALDRGKSLGYFSETHGQTTVAGLVALTDAGTTHKQPILD